MRHCAQARKLFGPCWDDETTQAEREWLESHLVTCAACRAEYEVFTRSLELVGSLPRHEPAPDLLERTLARARRTVPARDRVLVAEPRWIPVTAAAALVLVVAAAVIPWLGGRQADRMAVSPAGEVRQPVLVGTLAPPANTAAGEASSAAEAPSSQLFTDENMAAMTDSSLFDHNEDVEFILDPVVVNSRGRATVSRTSDPVQGRQAVITF